MSNFTFENVLKVSEMIMDFVILNIMWFVGTALGLVILGWAPSTVACLTILREKIMKKEDYGTGIIKKFFKIYKNEFKKSNILGITMAILFLIVTINKMNFEVQAEPIFKMFSIMSTAAKIILLGIIVYAFPLYVHYEMKSKEYFVKGLTLIFARPLVTIFIVLWTFLILTIVRLIPGLIAIFGASVYLYGIMAINYQFFMRNEQRLKKASQES